ncbi:MAG: UDP-3-O-(3-hydroxymyristoyl)glucosamine N-acyltransferase [Archangium sp.]|nr:UDP-3-O-(3-hydroxymyristoyl)glucosamine N-acyltransferase [Archangium sp.]MDP3151180.1 UDP-3-O-(3-hydroxymyristoyl)glucosamine N-acyltransferase [Archangium sp.]MDP3570179.1 UDP-3-O-(3-hydroxymyristoyl)glucosamine N-acyltransferase [Archangium sp.]
MTTAAQLAALVGGTVEGDGAVQVTGVAGLDQAQAGQLSFFGNQKYKKALAATKASVVLVAPGAPPRGEKTYVVVQNPHLAFARVAQTFSPAKQHAPGISVKATVHPSAKVDATATVMDFVSIGAGTVVGPRVVLFPGVYLGEQVSIGEGTVLSANVCVLDRCTIGARCLLHPNAVIGADGFGFALDMSVPEHVKIPQAGIVRVEDDVEIGACSCVDRATTGETVVGQGSKIDNLVQVGHNSTVGRLSILCAQVGLAGTTELGMGVVLAGQVGVAGHLRIGDMAKVGAQGGVISDVGDGAQVMGSPSMPSRPYMRSSALFQKLPELQQELRDLKKRLDALEKGKTSP